jgi:hypothetical protein
MLTCLGRRTVSGLLCASGQQFVDWSAAYRLFEEERLCGAELFAPIRDTVCEHIPKDLPIVGSLDDTLLYKHGRKIAGASWRRDPLGPPFQTNFSWAQRFLQLSLILPEGALHSRGRAVPVDVVHAPTPKKPRKDAPADEWETYHKRKKEMSASIVGAHRIANLRQKLDADPATRERPLVVAVDGGYTNKSGFRNIPEGTTLIGRIRKDAQLFLPPPETWGGGKGRRRSYGAPLQTPEQIRTDETIPWREVDAFAGGRVHSFQVKVIARARWKSAGPKDMMLIVIRPLSYRPRKGAHLIYKEPAFLICSDPALPLEKALQAYAWRWEIEVDFREEKTLLGMGEAQVRTPTAAQQVPVFAAACFALLHLAAHQAGLKHNGLPLPRWRRSAPPTRCSTAQLINRVRGELWGKAMGVNFAGFDGEIIPTRSLQKSAAPHATAVLYATK